MNLTAQQIEKYSVSFERFKFKKKTKKVRVEPGLRRHKSREFYRKDKYTSE